ncbi:MAG: hypothetical protein H7258_05390 [Ferruginibacter sp.]|nr:hypothetical protein [Ferruginibacter sp.]
MGFLAWVVSFLLSLFFVPIGMIYGFIKCFNGHSLKQAFKTLDNKFFRMAVSKDQYGNVVCEELFNSTLRKKESKHSFGDEDETISSVIGKNLRDDTLSIAGKVLNKILCFFQKDHALKAIEDLND